MIVSPCRKICCSKFSDQLVGKFDVYLHAKKSTLSLTSFLRYCKDIANFGHVWPHTPKMIVSIWRNIWCFSASKISTSSFLFSRILQTCYFGYFGQAWLHTSKMILPPCRKVLHLSGGKKNHRPCFSGDITKISKLRILGTLGMPG